MDYITRQFINLTKKFRRELRQTMSNLIGALHKQTEAIREANQPRNNEKRPSPEIIAAVNLPESIGVHQNAEDARDERNYKRATFFVSSLTLGAIVVYAVLVHLQYQEMIKASAAAVFGAIAAKRSADTAAEALVSVQRAFVFSGPVTPVRNINITTKKVESYSFQFAWENSGLTPTKTMTSHINYVVRAKKLPMHFAFQDIWPKGKPHVYDSMFLGPHGLIRAVTQPIPINDIQAMLEQKAHIYFWGWVRYRDVFDKTPERITKFCVEWTGFSAERADPYDLDHPASPSPRLDSCDIPQSNCYDDQCTQH